VGQASSLSRRASCPRTGILGLEAPKADKLSAHERRSRVTFRNSSAAWEQTVHDKMFQDYILSSSTAFWDAFLKEDRAALKWLSEGFASELGDKGVFERK